MNIQDNLKYFGWIQELRIFLFPLTNLEIFVLYNRNITTGNIFIQSECKCPAEYPRNENEYSINCLPNTLSNKTNLRLNKNSQSIGFINDDNLNTTWMSTANPKQINLTLDFLNGFYLIEQIEIYFTSLPPTNLLMQRFYNDKWLIIHNYSTRCESNDTFCSHLPKFVLQNYS